MGVRARLVLGLHQGEGIPGWVGRELLRFSPASFLDRTPRLSIWYLDIPPPCESSRFSFEFEFGFTAGRVSVGGR